MKELQENSALYVLSRFCDRNYKKTIKNLANHEIFLNQIKGNFTILSNMVHQKQFNIEPLILSVATYNK